MLGVDRVLPALQFEFQSADPHEMTLQQTGLKPAIEAFDYPIALRPGGWDEDGFDLEPEAQPNYAREVACRRTPAEVFAGIVELELGGTPQALPTVAQEDQNVFHAARMA